MLQNVSFSNIPIVCRTPFRLGLAGLLILLVSGGVRAGPLDNPESAGLRPLGAGVYVDPALPAAEVAGLKRLVEGARRRVSLFYGGVSASPNIIFCGSDDCYCDLGGVGLGFSDGANVLVSPRGRRLAIVAHELAHVELASRVGGLQRVLHLLPQWFDEGLAVLTSMAREFNDEAWHEATIDGSRAPALSEIAAMNDWVARTGPNGEHMQMTYGTARREVARWFEVVGADGLADLLTALETREPFAEAYTRIEHQHREAAARREAVAAKPEEAAVESPVAPFSPPQLRGRAAW
jgi:hypothetical protein